MVRASAVPDTPQSSRDSISNLLRAISVTVSIKDGQICNRKVPSA